MPENKLTDAQRVRVRAAMLRSVDRLKRLVEADGPDLVVCRELLLTCERAMVLYAEWYWKVWQEWMTARVRNVFGLCSTCQGVHHSVELSCPQCVKDGEEYVDALEREEPKGPPCQ